MHQLSELFYNLEFCEDPAVTPTIDLAKLALVTSQDEEEDDQDRTGTDSSNDTDATLVEDAPPRVAFDRSSSSPDPGQSPTVLGKRHREPAIPMDVDQPADLHEEERVAISEPTPEEALAGPSTQSALSPSGFESADKHNGINMTDISVGAGSSQVLDSSLPLRKPKQGDDSVMMFGRFTGSWSRYLLTVMQDVNMMSRSAWTIVCFRLKLHFLTFKTLLELGWMTIKSASSRGRCCLIATIRPLRNLIGFSMEKNGSGSWL